MSSFLLNVPTWAYLYFKDLSYSDFFTHNGLKFFMKNYYNVLSPFVFTNHSDFFNFFLGKYFLNFQNIKSFMKKSNYILTDNAKSDQLPWVILMFNFHNILCNNKFLVKIILLVNKMSFYQPSRKNFIPFWQFLPTNNNKNENFKFVPWLRVSLSFYKQYFHKKKHILEIRNSMDKREKKKKHSRTKNIFQLESFLLNFISLCAI